MRSLRDPRWFVTALVFAAIGCSNDLPRASDIAHMRVLGATTEVRGDPGRSTPKPGETASMTWSMAYPDLTQDDSQLESLFFTCTAPVMFTGTPVCQELLDVAQGRSLSTLLGAIAGARAPDCGKTPDKSVQLGPFSLTCVSGTPHSDIAIASNFKAGAKLIEGIICRNGTPQFDLGNGTNLTCTAKPDADPKDVENIAVYGTAPVEYGAQTTNQNPSIDATSLFFGQGKTPWPAVDDSASLADWVQDCSAAARAGQLLSSDGLDEIITLAYDASAREQVDKAPEALEFSTYVTSGKLNHRFVLFNSDAKLPLQATLDWELPKPARDTLGDDSELLRFYFTVLDHRGGFASTTRELCVGRDLTRVATP